MGYIVFYDGVCGLCNRSVRWLIAHDKDRVLRYASIQSDFAHRTLAPYHLDIDSGTIIFLEEDHVFTRSEAIIRIFRQLGGVYRFMGGLIQVLPRKLRDWLYDVVAKYRYKWFGKHKSCPLPDANTRELFLDQVKQP